MTTAVAANKRVGKAERHVERRVFGSQGAYDVTMQAEETSSSQSVAERDLDSCRDRERQRIVTLETS